MNRRDAIRETNGALALALGLALGSSASAAESEYEAKATAAAGFDSNAFRTFTSAAPSAFTLVMAMADGSIRGDQQGLSGNFMAGAKGFAPALGASSVAQSLDLVWGLNAPRGMRVGVEGRENTLNTVIDDRDHAEAGGVAFLDLALIDRLSLRLTLGARQYWFLPLRDYDSFGAEMGATLRFVPSRRHTFFAAANLSPRRYAGEARLPDGSFGEVPRQDTELYATAGYLYRGRFAVDLSYELFADFSNSYGERLYRHRINGAIGTKIPVIDVYANLAATLQLAVYPDGVYLSTRDVALEDNERHSSASLTLSKPLTNRWELEARYAFYLSAFILDGLYYIRHVATIGVSARF